MKFSSKAIAIASAATLTATLATAPAFADSKPVTVTATVGTTLSFGGSPGISDFSFGSIATGTTTTKQGAESYNIQGNTSYTLTITGNAQNQLNGAVQGHSMPNTVLSVAETGAHAQAAKQFPATGPLTLLQSVNLGGSGVDIMTEDWSINPPRVTPADTYTESFTYNVVAG